MAEKELKTKMERVDDDDNCSEFSVISVYDDQDDIDSVQNGSVTGLPQRITYIDRSVHESEFADNSSVASRNAASNDPTSDPLLSDPLLADLQRSASWNPMSLSGYVPTASVADLIDKVLVEYKEKHDLLASINSSIMELKSLKSSNSSEAVGQGKDKDILSTSSDVEKLKAQLAAANSRISELEKEKTTAEQQFKSAAKDAERHILLLESQLSDQCQMNKALREELDEKMDELQYSQDELRAHRMELDNQISIVTSLQQEKEQSEEQMQMVCNAYEEKMSDLEQTFKSYHERNEPITASTQTTTTASIVNPSSNSLSSINPSLTNQSSVNSPSFSQVSFQARQSLVSLPPNRSSLVCHLCQCDCPTQDYYKYHLQTTHCSYKCELCNVNFVSQAEMQKHSDDSHWEPRPNLSPLHFQRTENAPYQENASQPECYTPVSEFSASFVLDNDAESADSVSTAEEALSDMSDDVEENVDVQEQHNNTVIQNIEENNTIVQENNAMAVNIDDVNSILDNLEEIASSIMGTENASMSILDAPNDSDFDEDELADGFKTPESYDGEMSTISSKFEAPGEHEVAEFNFDVQELCRKAEMTQESILNESDVREALKLLENSVNNDKNGDRNETVLVKDTEFKAQSMVQEPKIGVNLLARDTEFKARSMAQEIKKSVERIVRPALQLPISQHIVQHQIFLCDCLCAFPTKGSLVTHKAYCTTANS